MSGPIKVFIEDGFKAFGIVSWLGYFLMVCSFAVDRIAAPYKS